MRSARSLGGVLIQSKVGGNGEYVAGPSVPTSSESTAGDGKPNASRGLGASQVVAEGIANISSEPIRVLRPRHRPRTPFPGWTIGLFVVALVVDILVSFVGDALAVFGMAFSAVAAVGLAILAMWVEDAFHQRLRGRHFLLRLLATFLFIVAVPPVMFAMTVVWLIILDVLGIESGLPLMWAVAGVAASVAAVGTMVVLVIDSAIQLIRPVLRTRVMATVFGLGAVAFLLSVASTAMVVSFQRVLAWSKGSNINLGYWSDQMSVSDAVAFLTENAFLVGVGIHVATALLSLPAIISATSKLASSVTERLEPLGDGFHKLAQGDRNIEVEVGGSRDIMQVIRRFNEMVRELRLAERMERAFGVYVSDQVLGRIRDQHGEAELPAQLREATVFFADIRGFTAMSEQLSPEQVLSILNRYYERVVAIIDAHQGYLDKFIGDAVVVVFNGPIDQPDHAERAVRCAIEIQEVIHEMNRGGEFPEIGALKVGAGICSGPMVCGNVGSSQQMEYTVIGDTVNLAARFCGHAAAGEVWVNEGCAGSLDVEALPYTALEAMLVKGKVEPVVPHRVWPRPSPDEPVGLRTGRDTMNDEGGSTIGDDDKLSPASTELGPPTAILGS